jgi:hypothetical protein
LTKARYVLLFGLFFGFALSSSRAELKGWKGFQQLLLYCVPCASRWLAA